MKSKGLHHWHLTVIACCCTPQRKLLKETNPLLHVCSALQAIQGQLPGAAAAALEAEMPASIMRDHAMARFLIVVGANPNASLLRDPYPMAALMGVKKGMGPLHIAVLSREWEIVELLLQYGANAGGKDGAGKRAEDYLPANLKSKLKALEKKAR